MVCKECNQEKGCGCSFHAVPNRDYRVCNDCKNKLKQQNELQNDQRRPPTPNVQGV